MSYGLMCLRCRRYVVNAGRDSAFHCMCLEPIPSEDGKTPLDAKPSRWQQAARNALERAIERHG